MVKDNSLLFIGGLAALGLLLSPRATTATSAIPSASAPPSTHINPDIAAGICDPQGRYYFFWANTGQGYRTTSSSLFLGYTGGGQSAFPRRNYSEVSNPDGYIDLGPGVSIVQY